MLSSTRKIYNLILRLLVLGILFPSQYVVADQDTKLKSESDYFAIINDQMVVDGEYIYRFRKALREKFFHGRISEEELSAFKKEVAEQLVTDVLLDQEARKKGLVPDTKKVSKRLEEIEKTFNNAESAQEREEWEEGRDNVLPVIKASLERESTVKQLEEFTKTNVQATPQELRGYYENNKDKFTEPQQWDVSMILLSVDPASPSDVWEETVEKAEKLLKKIRGGESFEELARIHSGDESAANGGHMGYMHIGMFGEPAQKVLNVMEPGDLSEPVVLLEGVAILRLDGVQEPSLNTLKDVADRAGDLLKRDLGEKAWAELKTRLRESADVKYSQSVLKDLGLAANGRN